MGYVVVNVVFANDSDNILDRRTAVIEYDFKQNVFGIEPRRNWYGVKDDTKKLVNIEKVDDKYRIKRFVESIYVDDVKVYDYNDYEFNYCKEKNICRLDYRNNIKIPKI